MEIQSIQNKLDEHSQNWINHLDRMTDERVLQYSCKPAGLKEPWNILYKIWNTLYKIQAGTDLIVYIV
jgi:hypothetical protein